MGPSIWVYAILYALSCPMGIYVPMWACWPIFPIRVCSKGLRLKNSFHVLWTRNNFDKGTLDVALLPCKSLKPLGTPPSRPRGCRGSLRSGSVGASLPCMPPPAGARGAGRGGLVPRLQGSVPAVAGSCQPALFPIRGSAHWMPGHCLGLCPRFPLPTALPLLRSVVPRGGGGGRAALRALRRDMLHPSSAVGGAWRSRTLGAAARVSGQRVREGTPLLCVPARRVTPACPYLAVPHPCARGCCGPQGSWVTSPTLMTWRAEGRGGGAEAQGAMACRGVQPGPCVCSPPLSEFAIRGPGLGLPGVMPDPRRVAASSPAAGAIARGFRRPLRLRLCWGWANGGGWFLGRWHQRPRSARRARGSQTLASASVTRSTAPPSRRAGHPCSRSGNPAQITARRTSSWSSQPTHPPGRTSGFPPSLQRSTASKVRFLYPLVVPEVAQLSHSYTSITMGEGLAPKGVGDRVPVPVQSLRPSAGRGSPTAPCAKSARGPCGAGAAGIHACSFCGSRTAGAGSCGASPCRRGSGWRRSWGGSGGIRTPQPGSTL